MAGVIIKGMKMPESCGSCPCFHADYPAYCQAIKEARRSFIIAPYRERADFCPLIEIPKHGRLGDLDRLEQMFADIDNAPYSGFDGTEPFYSAEDAAQIIRLAHTVIPAEEDET